MELNSKQRAYLKGLASVLEPVLQIGKGSLTPEVTESVAEAFNNRELVKITVLKNCFDNPKELASVLAERTHSTVVQVIGKKIVLYKENKDKKKIELFLITASRTQSLPCRRDIHEKGWYYGRYI